MNEFNSLGQKNWEMRKDLMLFNKNLHFLIQQFLCSVRSTCFAKHQLLISAFRFHFPAIDKNNLILNFLVMCSVVPLPLKAYEDVEKRSCSAKSALVLR